MFLNKSVKYVKKKKNVFYNIMYNNRVYVHKYSRTSIYVVALSAACPSKQQLGLNMKN